MNCLRINNLKIKDADLRERIFKQYRIHLTALPFCKHTYMTSDNLTPLTRSTFFAEGLFYVQNASSLLPVCVLDPRKFESILDIAAAPGGKTMHIASRMHNTGEILANDISKSRLTRLRTMAQTFGVTNMTTTSKPGQTLWQTYPNQFDRVLVDAPCTMRGTDTPSTDSPKKVSRIQKSLLRAAIACCKPGGTIVYATCTTTREENEDVITWILEKERGVIDLETVSFKDVPRTILKDTSRVSAEILDKTWRVPKEESFEGFFIAEIHKKIEPYKVKHI